MKSIEIHEIHWNSIRSMKIRWNPFKFKGMHGNSIKSMQILWNPWKRNKRNTWKFDEIHRNSMKSIESYGIHGNSMKSMEHSVILLIIIIGKNIRTANTEMQYRKFLHLCCWCLADCLYCSFRFLWCSVLFLLISCRCSVFVLPRSLIFWICIADFL